MDKVSQRSVYGGTCTNMKISYCLGMEINNFTTITDKTQHLSSEVMLTEIKVISFSRQEQLYLSQKNSSSQ